MDNIMTEENNDVYSKIQKVRGQLSNIEKVIQEYNNQKNEMNKQLDLYQNQITQQKYSCNSNCFQEDTGSQMNYSHQEIEYEPEYPQKYPYLLYNPFQQCEQEIVSNPLSIPPTFIFNEQEYNEMVEQNELFSYLNPKSDFQEFNQELHAKLNSNNNIDEEKLNMIQMNNFPVNQSSTQNLQYGQNSMRDNADYFKIKEEAIFKKEDMKINQVEKVAHIPQIAILIPKNELMQCEQSIQKNASHNLVNKQQQNGNIFEQNKTIPINKKIEMDDQHKQMSNENRKAKSPTPLKKSPKNSSKHNNNIIYHTPSKSTDTSQEEEMEEGNQKNVPKKQKIKKERSPPKKGKKIDITDTQKITRKQKKMQKKKSNSFNKEKSSSNDTKSQETTSPQYNNSMILNTGISNSNEMTSNDQQQMQLKCNLLTEEEQNTLQQLYLSQMQNVDEENKPKLAYLNKKKQQVINHFCADVEEEVLQLKYLDQISYLFDLVENRIQEEFIESGNESDSCSSNQKKQKKRGKKPKKFLEIPHPNQFDNNQSKLSYLRLGHEDVELLNMQKNIVKQNYNKFLKKFNEQKQNFGINEKGHLRYPTDVKMIVVEFTKYMKVIQLQKDTSISQETIRKWQKRYAGDTENIMQFDVME